MSQVDLQSLPPSPPSPLPSENLIIEWCTREAAHVDNHRFFVYPSRENPQAFIKYGPREMLSEAKNQEFAFQAFKQLQQEEVRVRVPEIYYVIEHGEMVYIVMEYIHGETFKDILHQETSTEKHYNQIAEAINLFLRVEILDSTPPGPIGKGIIRHPLFKDTRASVKYESVKALEVHVNKVANRFLGNDLKIDFSGERLCLCFSDLFEGNFMFAGPLLYVVDFEDVSILPESFMTYALSQPRPICEAIRDKYSLPQTNLEALKAAAYYFMVSSRTVGKYYLSISAVY